MSGEAGAVSAVGTSGRERGGRPALLLAAFALSGAAALSYEVVWTRALSIVLGSTTFALSSMLATFMLGLALGGMAGGRIADRPGSALARLGACELGIGVAGLASLPVIALVPGAYLAAYRAFHMESVAFYVVQIALCSLVMLVPTFLMGMTFPLAVRALAASPERLGAIVGKVYGFNTLGSVAGSLVAGFLLVPALGLRGTAILAASTNLVVGVSLLAASRTRWRWLAPLVGVPHVLLAVHVGRMESGEGEWAVANLYTASRYMAGGGYDAIVAKEHGSLERLFEGNSPEGYVAVYRTVDDRLLVQTGGKIEGTAVRDEATARLLAVLPVAAHADPRSMLVVGLGAGVTLATARQLVPAVELVEIHRGEIRAMREVGPDGLLEGVVVHRDDARSFLLRGERRYDVISSEPSYPTDFGVANLFTREFFALASERLTEGGVYCQWLPYYALDNDDVTMMVKTFGQVFPEAMLWKVPGSLDLLLLGSRRPFARAPREIAAEVARRFGGDPPDLVLSRDAEGIRAVVRRPDVPVNTDDHPILEFRVARNFLVGDVASLDR